MNATEVLAELSSRGVRVWPAGDRLRFFPAEAVPPGLLSKIRSHKVQLLQLVAGNPELAEALPGGIEKPQSLTLAEVCAMPLEGFAQARLRVVVSSKVLGEEVLFASDNATVDPGERRVVYRAAELQAILGAKPEELCSLHAAKKAFGATLSPA